MTDAYNHQATPAPVVALTIAGSDSGGGAGIAADLHTFASHGVFGTLALTAVTAQNTEKVHDVVAFDPAFVASQIDAVLGDFSVEVAKTGMLATVAIIDLLTERAQRGQLPRLVIDPVMVSSTGATLLEGNGRAAYHRLLAHGFIATPNLIEAQVLLEREIRTIGEMEDAARDLYGLGVRIAVIKGGHLAGEDSTDVIFDGQSILHLPAKRIATRNTHGTGCALSAAITANLALGHEPLVAIERAKAFVTDAIARAANWQLGGGSGPIHHFGQFVKRD